MEFNAGCIKNTSVDPGIVPTRSNAMHSAARSAVPHWNKIFFKQLQQPQPGQSAMIPAAK
jgi:hypothetical protein